MVMNMENMGIILWKVIIVFVICMGKVILELF